MKKCSETTVVSHTDGSLSKTARARRTLARIVSAWAVQQTVYNAHVAHWHTFAVGATGLLVHNRDPKKGNWDSDEQLRGGIQGFKSAAQRKTLESLKNSFTARLRGKQIEAFKEAIESSKIGEQFISKDKLREIFEEIRKNVKP